MTNCNNCMTVGSRTRSTRVLYFAISRISCVAGQCPYLTLRRSFWSDFIRNRENVAGNLGGYPAACASGYWAIVGSITTSGDCSASRLGATSCLDSACTRILQYLFCICSYVCIFVRGFICQFICLGIGKETQLWRQAYKAQQQHNTAAIPLCLRLLNHSRYNSPCGSCTQTHV